MIETLHVAFAGLTANKLRSGLTILGLTIGVGSVIVLIAVGTGSSTAVAKQIDALGSNVLLVTAPPALGGLRRAASLPWRPREHLSASPEFPSWHLVASGGSMRPRLSFLCSGCSPPC